MRLFIAMALAAFSGAAHGEVNCATVIGSYKDCGANNYYILPPQEYIRSYPGKIIENTAEDMQHMAFVCAPNPMAAVSLGCATPYVHSSGEKRCYIWFAPDWYLNSKKVTIDAVRKHEIAHCLGWPQTHPR